MNDQKNTISEEENSNMTKAQRKKERREEKQAQRAEESKRKSRRKVMRWVSFVIGIVVVVGGFSLLGGGSTEESGGGDTRLTEEVSDSDWAKGGNDARATLVEYGDFQCPACGAFHPVVSSISEELGDDLKVVFRHFPIERAHPNARIAALATESAGIQGKFWEMHDLIFERQTDWSSGKDAQEKFEGYAEELGLDVEKFKEDLKLDELDKKIDAHRTAGTRAGVNSTPTFFLNGEKMENFDTFEEFREAITSAAREES